MFDFEFSKLLVIGVIALLVIKPKDLPRALHQLGYWVRHARQVAAEFQRSLEQMAREAEIPDVKKEIEDAGRQLTADIEKTIDPVEIEKALTPLPLSDAVAASNEAAASQTIAPPAPSAADEPTLPFPEPLPTQSPPVAVHPPALEPAGSPSSPHDRG